MIFKEYASYLVAIFATLVRYYDYALFGLSASVLSKAFMPDSDEGYQIMLFFAVFSISVAARPMGSIIFGKIGDCISRIVSVKIAVIIAAISTSSIAFIPSFSYFGWFSVVLLTLLRMLFMVSLSGEVDAIKILVAEKIGKKKRNFAIGIVSFSSQIGVLLASFMYYIAINSNDVEFMWRFNFAFGGLLGIGVFAVRGYLEESSVFLKSKSVSINDQEANLTKIIIDNRSKFFLSMVVSGVLGGGYNFLIIFLGTFAAKVVDTITISQASYNNVLLIVLYAIGCFLSGYIGDKINVIKQIIISLSLTIICVILMSIFFKDIFLFLTLHKLLAFFIPFYSIPCGIKVQSLFPAKIRMRMYSLSHSLGSMLFSSTTPFICMLIWRNTGEFLYVLGGFLSQLILLFLVLIYIQKKQFDNLFET